MSAATAKSYLTARREHPAWQLLASTKGPILLSCLKALFSQTLDGLDWETAELALADVLKAHVASGDIDIDGDDYVYEARRELRQWIKRALIIERQGKIIATDALEMALSFVDSLDNRIMTSTASRLSIVQREIESLEAHLNPDPQRREAHIQSKIDMLQAELKAVQAGEVKVLGELDANEAIREIYSLATSLRTDFRRVEDSYREADKRLRKSIISEQNHRGEIVDKLLDGHESLLETAEGRVFTAFQQQLIRSDELESMKLSLRKIVSAEEAKMALSSEQQTELRWLIMRLVAESQQVIRARARSERDVKGFLKTGLAAEHHRVGELLSDIFAEAMKMDWSKQSVRRTPSPLPPVAIANANLPIIERIRFKTHTVVEAAQLNLSQQHTNLNDVEDEFWNAFDGLDRELFLSDTQRVLEGEAGPMGIAALAGKLPPTHDLESIALWLTMAMDAEVADNGQTEQLDVDVRDGPALRFTVPKVALTAQLLAHIDLEV